VQIIDAHIHFSDTEMLKMTARNISHLDYSSAGLSAEFKKSNVVLGIGMGLTEATKNAFPCSEIDNPMRLDLEANLPDRVVCCPGINPTKLQGAELNTQLSRIEAELQRENVVGLKIYAGYYHYYVYDKIYGPIYELASHYHLPVVIHSGDTYSDRGLLRYSHPLAVDELAVTHRDITFVIAHLGCPWVMDTAEVVYKNENVYSDFSGLVVGDQELGECIEEPLFLNQMRSGMVYSGYKKYLFGSDWPLTKLKPYIDFAKKIIPEKHHDDFFYNNAVTIFPKTEKILAKIGAEDTD
jgi:predicted TIM-barrel fold metal-dependent hydrolase